MVAWRSAGVLRRAYGTVQFSPSFGKPPLLRTRVLPSRFNEGSLARPQFEVLYLAETPIVALFQVQAVFGVPTQPGGVIANPCCPWSVINVQVHLQDVADLTQVSQQTLLATTAQELTGDWQGYQQRNALTSVSEPICAAPTQLLGAALFAVVSPIC